MKRAKNEIKMICKYDNTSGQFIRVGYAIEGHKSYIEGHSRWSIEAYEHQYNRYHIHKTSLTRSPSSAVISKY